ncbi:hypothetical protein OJAV_G00162340 [Oryzias javanicus]|uniref:Uncharacterized protein n=1 Tax=Oryzias javanicus TaxID=123683 RepID=A0A3S2LWX3_ORYJA|nr:hypothetical protein OJAV_G00162340 [Oryzias javanicus]
MSADTVSDKALSEDGDIQAAENSDFPFLETLKNLDDRLAILSKNISLCSSALSELKDLQDVLAKKRLQDASSPPQQ